MIGQTPNPCVECNRYIKFDELQKKAEELNADFIATGHYCKRTYSPKTKQYFLKKAKDSNKDQTYFLYMLSSEQLSKTLFPLGNLTKAEIRELAKKFKLNTANKQESQEICFVTHGSYKDFIEEQLEKKQAKPGPILDLEGNKLAEHKGIHNYTIGQRKGLNISAEKPLYVLKISAKDNSITVGHQGHLHTSKIYLENVTTVQNNKNLIGKEFDIKTRYRMVPFKAKVIEFNKDKLTLESTSPQEFISPGQSGVLYDKDNIIGGGIICQEKN